MIVLDRALLASAGDECGAQLRGARWPRRARRASATPARSEPGEQFPGDLLTSFVPGDAPAGRVLAALARRVPPRGCARRRAARARRRPSDRTRELAELTSDRRRALDGARPRSLLEMILTQARRVTASDAGSLYLVERDDDGAPTTLRFAHARRTISLPVAALRGVHRADRSHEPRRLRGGDGRAARDRRRVPAARRRRVPAEPQLRRQRSAIARSRCS